MTARDLAKQIVWSQRKRLGFGLLLLLVDRAAGFVVPLAPKVLVDEVVGHRRADILPWIAVAVVLAACVQGAAVFALARVLGLSAERVVLGWRRRIMARITRFPARRLDATQTGVLVSRIMDDSATMQNLVGWELVRWTSNLLTAVVALVALLVIDWRMTSIALAFAAVPGLALHLSHRKLRPLYREKSRLRAEVTGRLTQTLSGIRVVKAYAAEKREQLVFARGLHSLFRVMSQATTRKAVMNAAAVMISAGVIAIVLVLGGRSVLEQKMTLGDFGSYIAFALMFAAPLLDLPEIATRVSETLADLDRLREIEAVAPEDAAGGDRVDDVKGDVVFHDVSFGYVPGERVLHGISFSAAAGTTTAIVGSSGAGKSTLFALLMGFHHPDEGRITIDGRDLATLRLRDYRRTLAVVLQDEYLFDGTIAENIAFGTPRASREAIAVAATAACLDELQERLPLGLETRVGERGVLLSGGQRQRVAIARAFLADAPILLLDEATSSLDAENEEHVRTALARLRRDRTVFVIAHRLTTIRTADRILVLDRGRLVESGAHADLLARSGRYRALHRPFELSA